MSVIHLTAENFDNEVLKSEIPVLVDFFATWCGPCRMIAPTIEKIAVEHPEYKICKVDVDEQGALAERFEVMSIPTLFVFKNGEIVNHALGAMTEAQILALLQ